MSSVAIGMKYSVGDGSPRSERENHLPVLCHTDIKPAPGLRLVVQRVFDSTVPV